MTPQITCLWTAPEAPRAFQTAISLHGHTLHSRESLTFIPVLASRNHLLDWALSTQSNRPKKVRVDFAAAYWTPPLTARAAYEVERSQIECGLGLKAIVSLTDHESIEAPLQLRYRAEHDQAPISLEWTVPFRAVEVHLGVHNLPPGRAVSLVAEMQAYTADPHEAKLAELLAALSEIPEVLIVLNHPLWDTSGARNSCYRGSLDEFLRLYKVFVHALEINGCRSPQENQAVLELAQGWTLPVVSGGDRHGCEPSAALNLTRAETMDEFVSEVRKELRSHLLFMPQYRQSEKLRTIQTILDVVHEYPAHPLGSRWDERVFHPDSTGTARPLSVLWGKPPRFIGILFSIFRLLEANAVSRDVRPARGRVRPARQLTLRPGGETA